MSLESGNGEQKKWEIYSLQDSLERLSRAAATGPSAPQIITCEVDDLYIIVSFGQSTRSLQVTLADPFLSTVCAKLGIPCKVRRDPDGQ